MIHLFTGKTGSGKTLLMVKEAYKYWYNGEDIYSNTKLFYSKFGGHPASNIVDNPDQFSRSEQITWFIKYRFFKILSKIRKKEYNITCPTRGRITYFDEITELIEVRDGIILMDEGQNLLDARNWENLPLEFSNKLRQHRKHKLDLFCTTQSIGTIDVNLRRLVQRWIHCTDRFALFGIRNPNWLSVHTKEFKDIDMLYEQSGLDALKVDTVKKKWFIIHRFKARYYDTYYDIGFKAYRIIWTQRNKEKVCLIIPKHWTLSNARQQLSLLKYFYDQTRLKTSKTIWKTYGKDT